MTSLESEVDRLSQSLNAQRTVITVAETSARKMSEEHAREASSQVCKLPGLRDTEADVVSKGTRDRTAEAAAQGLW